MRFPLGEVLLASSLGVLAGIALFRFPVHLNALDWPPHAKAHLLGQIGTTIGLCLWGAMVLACPFRARARWAWWSLALGGIAVFGSYWIAHAALESDAPWRSGNTTFALLTACYLAGLALSWSGFYGKRA